MVSGWSLLRFRRQLDIGRIGESGFLLVVCGSVYGDRRSDGISVVLEGALGT